MDRSWRPPVGGGPGDDRLRTDGGEDDDRSDPAVDDPEEPDGEADDGRDTEVPDREPDDGRDAERSVDADDVAEVPGEAGDGGPDRANVEVTDAGAAEPAAPEWDRPDPEDIPEFEIRADEPAAGGGGAASGHDGAPPGRRGDADPTAGRPNSARSPGQSRIKQEGTEGYLVAVELCAQLPDEVRLPEDAADLVPAAVEAEVEEDVRSFAAAEFDDPTPTVTTLSFDDVDGEVWLRLRLGVPPDAFDDLDPDAIRAHALEELEGLF